MELEKLITFNRLINIIKAIYVMAVRYSELNKGLFTLMLTGKALNQRESSKSGAKLANESAQVEALFYICLV